MGDFNTAICFLLYDSALWKAADMGEGFVWTVTRWIMIPAISCVHSVAFHILS